MPDPGFSGDDGSASSDVEAALAAYAQPGGSRLAALQVLQHARLLVPVVAVLGEVEVDEAGLAHDKSSDMATVLMTAPDGRRGLLAFTSGAAMARWDPAARPVPVAARLAAQAARQESADALVVDVAGPVPFAVEGDSLVSLAEGLVLTRLRTGTGTADADRFGWVKVDA
ncbi:SseB family protein [Nocardioides sp. HDW12B]|nr:SseB family protein [Nocardioides sp. HDW12B]